MTTEHEWNGLKVRRSADSRTGWERQSSHGGWFHLSLNWSRDAAIVAELDKLYPLPPEPKKRVELPNGNAYEHVGDGVWGCTRWVGGSSLTAALDRIWELENPPAPDPDDLAVIANSDGVIGWKRVGDTDWRQPDPDTPRVVRLHTGEELRLDEDCWISDTSDDWIYDSDGYLYCQAIRTLDLLQNGPRPGLGEA